MADAISDALSTWRGLFEPRAKADTPKYMRSIFTTKYSGFELGMFNIVSNNISHI